MHQKAGLTLMLTLTRKRYISVANPYENTASKTPLTLSASASDSVSKRWL